MTTGQIITPDDVFCSRCLLPIPQCNCGDKPRRP